MLKKKSVSLFQTCYVCKLGRKHDTSVWVCCFTRTPSHPGYSVFCR